MGKFAFDGLGGDGGGGLHFRVPPDIFTGPNIADSRTARDTYFATTAGAAALPQFQGDQSLAIIIDPTSTTDNTFETYSPGQSGMAYDNSQWLERTDAVQGNPGFTGWTPALAIITDADRRVFQVIDWTGGTGTKPATGQYVGLTGLVTAIADAIDIRGPAVTGALLAANNLDDLDSTATARTNLDVVATAIVTALTGRVSTLEGAGYLNTAMVQALIDAGMFQTAAEVQALIDAGLFQNAAMVQALIDGAGHASQADLLALAARVTVLEGYHLVNDHTRRLTRSADTTLTAAEVTAGASSMNSMVTLLAWGAGVEEYLFAGVPEAEADITDLLANGFSVFAAYQRHVDGSDDPIIVSGHKWWRSVDAQDGEFNVTLEVIQ